MKKRFSIAVLIVFFIISLSIGIGFTSLDQIIESYMKVSMPDFGQHSPCWCWVAAAKNSFWWFSNNGFPRLEDDPAQPPGNGEWKKIDPDSMNSNPDGKDNDADGLIDEDPYDGKDNDGDGMIDEDGNDWYDSMQDWTYNPETGKWDYTPVPPKKRHGYRKDFRKLAEATWRDKNKNGQKDEGEENYIYSQPVRKWDYLLGLANFIKIQGAAPGRYGYGLIVHDIADPEHPFGKVVPLFIGPGGRDRHDDPGVRNPKDTPNSRDVLEKAGIKICFRAPTFFDYARDLLHSEDVILMTKWDSTGFDDDGDGKVDEDPIDEQDNDGDGKVDEDPSGLQGGHVVTGVSFEGKDTDGDGKVNQYWIDFSDPWSHMPKTQPGDIPPPGQPGHDCPRAYSPKEPDHNNSPAHDQYPYDKAKVLKNTPFKIKYRGKTWQIVDLIFISPVAPKYKPVGLVRLRGTENTIKLLYISFTYKTVQEPVIVNELEGLVVRPGETREVILPADKYPWPDDIHIKYRKDGVTQPVRTIPTYLNDQVEDPAPNKKYNLNGGDIALIESIPDLVVADIFVTDSAGAGFKIPITDITRNIGYGEASVSITGYYLSTDTKIDSGDKLLGSRVVPDLAAGKSSLGSTYVLIPPETEQGEYYIIAKADYLNYITEIKENNNTRSSKIIKIVKVQ